MQSISETSGVSCQTSGEAEPQKEHEEVLAKCETTGVDCEAKSETQDASSQAQTKSDTQDASCQAQAKSETHNVSCQAEAKSETHDTSSQAYCLLLGNAHTNRGYKRGSDVKGAGRHSQYAL